MNAPVFLKESSVNISKAHTPLILCKNCPSASVWWTCTICGSTICLNILLHFLLLRILPFQGRAGELASPDIPATGDTVAFNPGTN